MSLILTEQQRQSLPDDAETPVEVVDDHGRKFYLISESAYRRIKLILEAEEIDPSLYEVDDFPEQ